jgi:hypothetical protein
MLSQEKRYRCVTVATPRELTRPDYPFAQLELQNRIWLLFMPEL